MEIKIFQANLKQPILYDGNNLEFTNRCEFSELEQRFHFGCLNLVL